MCSSILFSVLFIHTFLLFTLQNLLIYISYYFYYYIFTLHRIAMENVKYNI